MAAAKTATRELTAELAFLTRALKAPTLRQSVARLADAHAAGWLQGELVRLGRHPLIVVDEVGYIPFEAEAANLFFQLVSARYERASLIVTSNKPFGRWGEVFGDNVVAAAMIGRLVHHAEVVALKGDSYRLRDRDLGRVPAAATKSNDRQGDSFHPSPGGQISADVDTLRAVDGWATAANREGRSHAAGL
jgi:hypothetical protein